MDLKICENGHYYDGDKYSTCPHCLRQGEQAEGKVINVSAPAVDNGVSGAEKSHQKIGKSNTDGKTVGHFNIKHRREKQVAPKEESYSILDTNREKEPEESRKTISRYQQEGEELPVGWLICVEGQEYGTQYPLKAGKNTIGRSVEMNIVLRGDANISRENHAVIVFDPQEGNFLISPAECRNLVYINGKVLAEVICLEKNDILRMGDTKLLMVPLCDRAFSWDLFQGKPGPESIKSAQSIEAVSSVRSIQSSQSVLSIWECPICKSVNQGNSGYCKNCGCIRPE